MESKEMKMYCIAEERGRGEDRNIMVKEVILQKLVRAPSKLNIYYCSNVIAN